MKFKGFSRNFDTFYTYATLNSVLRIFCLSYIYRDGIKLKYSYSIFKIVFFLVVCSLLNALITFLKIQNRDIEDTMNFMDSVEMIFWLGYFQYLTDLFFVFKYGKETILEYFRVYDHIDRVLCMTYYNDIKRNIFYMVIYFSTFAVSSIVFDYVVWCVGVDWISATIESINYIYFLLRILVIFDIIAHIIQVEYRLKMMSDILEEFYVASESLPDIIQEVIIINKKEEPKNRKDTNRLDSLKTISLNREYSILTLSRCYLLLLEQIDFINKVFGFRILTTCISLLFDITILLNLVIRVLLGSLAIKINVSAWYPVASSTLLLFNRTFIILYGVYKVEQNYKQSKRIVRLVDLLFINKKINIETKKTLKQLRNLIISRPIQFHAVNFFTLDYRLLVSITSVVITYTLIFLQYVK